jgi:hypothetical protein
MWLNRTGSLHACFYFYFGFVYDFFYCTIINCFNSWVGCVFFIFFIFFCSVLVIFFIVSRCELNDPVWPLCSSLLLIQLSATTYYFREDGDDGEEENLWNNLKGNYTVFYFFSRMNWKVKKNKCLNVNRNYKYEIYRERVPNYWTTLFYSYQSGDCTLFWHHTFFFIPRKGLL